jgi:hypothetical protein
MRDELTAFEKETGYLPGKLHLLLTLNITEPELMLELDKAIGTLRKLDDLSTREQQFLDRFSAMSDSYWGM